jgi:hypothetical protein
MFGAASMVEEGREGSLTLSHFLGPSTFTSSPRTPFSCPTLALLLPPSLCFPLSSSHSAAEGHNVLAKQLSLPPAFSPYALTPTLCFPDPSPTSFSSLPKFEPACPLRIRSLCPTLASYFVIPQPSKGCHLVLSYFPSHCSFIP